MKNNQEMTIQEFNALDGKKQMERARYISTKALKELVKASKGIEAEMLYPMIDDAAIDGIIACLDCNTPDKNAAIVITNAAQVYFRHEYYLMNRDSSVDDDESASRLNVMAAKIPGPEPIVIARDQLERVFAEIPEKYRDECKAIYNGLYFGYKPDEMTKALNISISTIYRRIDALKAAAATIRAIDAESKKIETAIESDRRTIENKEKRENLKK